MIRQIEHLETREKLFLVAGGAILLVLFFIYGAYLPYRAALEQADKKITAKQSQIHDIEQLRVDYQSVKDDLSELENNRGQGSSLSALALIEDLAERIGSRENLVNIRPQTAQVKGNYRVEDVDVKFEKLPLSQLLRLLKGIETSAAQLQVKTLQMKQRFDNNALLDVSLTVSSFRKNS